MKRACSSTIARPPRAGWRSGWELVPLSGAEPACGVLGVRYRSFVPRRGLHPAIPAEGRVVLELSRRAQLQARITLHPWRPDGLPYEGLPRSAAEARERRAERFVVERFEVDGPASAPAPAARSAPPSALSPYCLDLRRARLG